MLHFIRLIILELIQALVMPMYHFFYGLSSCIQNTCNITGQSVNSDSELEVLVAAPGSDYTSMHNNSHEPLMCSAYPGASLVAPPHRFHTREHAPSDRRHWQTVAGTSGTDT